ncbi:MAG: glycoside hydrolase family 13 protein [Lachnospiraceae bacterium]|nr:glycoside hydrolase family 13 protein [Lachnospiraceae bacterium]
MNISRMLYPFQTRPVLNHKALFTDMTENFVSPMEPEADSVVTIRFRTAEKNVDGVRCISRDWQSEMKVVETIEGFDYYEAQLWIGHEPLEYYFEIHSGKIEAVYDSRGLAKKNGKYRPFVLKPDCVTPEWSKGAIMYQIFIDRFCNGDKTNDVRDGEYCYLGGKSRQIKDWDKPPELFDVNEFYGGDLQGVINKLPYLKELGIEAIYFNPLFVSPSSHKYDIQDYDYIDPHIGIIVVDDRTKLTEKDTDNKHAAGYIKRVTDKRNLEAGNALFIELVEKAHAEGIKVIIDGVFNHCGSFNKWLDRECIYEDAEGYEDGAFISKESPYNKFFEFKENDWPYNESYDGWWGHDTLPKLNYEGSKALYNYILHVAEKWVSPPYNADGWRLDVAADLGHSPEFNHRFWKDFRSVVKKANPNAVIIAEHYGNPESWLNGDQWDTVMNYDAFMEPVTWFLTGMQKHSDEFREDLLNNAEAFWKSMKKNSAHFTAGELMCAMNELSNHDHSRFMTRTNRKVGRLDTLGSDAASEGINKAVMREAVLMQMTWIGAPTIYYGDEAGVCGFTDPDNRRTYPWGHEDNELIDFHRALIRIRKENDELRHGSLIRLLSKHGVIAYARFMKHDVSIIVVNNNEHDVQICIKAQMAGVPRKCSMKRLILTHDVTFTTEPYDYQVEAGMISLRMGRTSAMILKKRSRENER